MTPALKTGGRSPASNLLIVGNFQPDVGYAWNTIGEYFLALGKMFRNEGARAIICYPVIGETSDRFKGDGLGLVEFDFWSVGLRDLYRFVRGHSIGYIYLTDRPIYSSKYLVCRLAGAKWIVVHDRTSGKRDVPGRIKKIGKRIVNKTPFAADIAIAISDYVRRRLIRVSCFSEEKVVRIWNGVDIRRFCPGEDDYVRKTFGIPAGKKIVFSHSRANRYKGVDVLIRAAGKLMNEEGREDVVFLYCGDGPDLGRFRDLIRDEKLEGRFLCPGKTDAVERILKGVSMVVVPSLWQEGFGLSVVEGMATGKPVVATRVGGIVEIITDGRDGYLVPPGDHRALAERIVGVLDDDDGAKRIGETARTTAVERFDIENKKKELTEVFRGLLALGHAPNS